MKGETSMANATKSTHKKPPAAHTPTQATGQPTPPAPANGHSQLATPPAKESRILPGGIIERYEHGQLISTEPAPKPKTPAPKATPAKAKAPTGPKPGEAYFVGRLGTEDLWQFAPISAEPGAAVVVRHYKGYELLSEYRRSANFADKLYHDMLEKGLVYIDGVKHKLVDEDA
jgi:hypothetical protein